MDKDCKAMLVVIEKCTQMANQFYDEVDQEENIDINRDSGDDKSQDSDLNDNFATNSEKISINWVAI